MSGPHERDPLLQSEAQLAAAPTAGLLPPSTAGSLKVPGQRPGPLEIPRSTRNGILAGIWVATFLSSLNTTLVATLLPSISSEFQRSNQASWLGTAYLCATCVFTPLYGRLCNVLGRRGANQTAVVFSALGTLACGLSGSMEMLIVARFLAGIGGGGIFTTATIITSDMFDMRSRGLTQGIASVFNSLGMGLGGPLGGLISDWLGWRWAFIIQIPLFVISFVLTSINLHYVTPGKSKSTKDVLKRIDYGGSITLLGAVLSFLIFLSNRYNDAKPWPEPSVIVPLVLSVVFFISFILFELLVAPEPMLAPFLLKEKIPVLVGVSNFLVANCNFAIMYFFPMWFQTVPLKSASVAGAHLLPNCVSISLGSLWAGWEMHRTGRYKKINVICGFFPCIGALLLSFMKEDSPAVQQWLSIIPLGFGNAVVLQTMLIALLAHLPENSMAVGTGFGQLFRGVGQVGGVGIASAIFQSKLDSELRRRITDRPDADEIIRSIRHSAKLVSSLEPSLQRSARDSYAIALRMVFIVAAASTFMAYLVRIPIPDKELDAVPHSKPKKKTSRALSGHGNSHENPSIVKRYGTTTGDSSAISTSGANGHVQSTNTSPSNPVRLMAEPGQISPVYGANETALDEIDEEAESGNEGSDSEESESHAPARPLPLPLGGRPRVRRLSTYTSSDGGMDLEDDVIGGSARPGSSVGSWRPGSLGAGGVSSWRAASFMGRSGTANGQGAGAGSTEGGR